MHLKKYNPVFSISTFREVDYMYLYIKLCLYCTEILKELYKAFTLFVPQGNSCDVLLQ